MTSYFVCIGVFFTEKTAYELRIRDWSSDLCSSDLLSSGGSSSMRLVAEPITEAAFAPFGQILTLPTAAGRTDYSAFADNRRPGRAGLCFRRSEERRVGKARVSTWSSPWRPYH